MTISEMVEKLSKLYGKKIPRKTVEMRLLRRGHKPISYEAQYSIEAYKDIINTPSAGRPPKDKKKT